MDKEKEIEKIAQILTKMPQCKNGCKGCGGLYEYGCTERDNAESLVSLGYGNVKQAVKEFAERLKAEINDLPKTALSFSVRHDAPTLIDLVYKELYGANE